MASKQLDLKQAEPVNGSIVKMPAPEPTPLSVIERAIEHGASVDTLAKLFELQERLDANKARNAFNEAFAATKAEFPRIEKTKEVDFVGKNGSRVKYKYAPLDKITEAVNPVLAKYGLSYNWKQEKGSVAGNISVTCFLRHVMGHYDTNTLEGPPDESGAKNYLHSIKSCTSYLRRGTLEGVLGIATADEDTDGITMGSASDFLANIEAASNMHELERSYKEAISAALKASDANAVKAFTAAKDKRKAQLGVKP